MKNKAFTLAEVLITLGIIGVVAAMTLPTLINKQDEKARITSLKKAYTVLNQAFMMAYEKEGTPDTWSDGNWIGANGAQIIFEKVVPFLKIIKKCDNTNTKQCFAAKYYTINNDGNKVVETSDINGFSGSSIVLADGQSIFFYFPSSACNTVTGDIKNICGHIKIDVNGAKKPNIYGEDLFMFYITTSGIIPYGMATEVPEQNSFKEHCLEKQQNGCAAWVVYNDNMDYLHCKDLSWNGKTKCSK